MKMIRLKEHLLLNLYVLHVLILPNSLHAFRYSRTSIVELADSQIGTPPVGTDAGRNRRASSSTSRRWILRCRALCFHLGCNLRAQTVIHTILTRFFAPLANNEHQRSKRRIA